MKVAARSTGVDLVSGNGLAEALAGTGAVIDVSNVATLRASVAKEFFEATGSPVPVSILRAAQFHEFPGQYLARSSGRFMVVPRWRCQPVAAREVATALAALATESPVPMSELAGPREENMANLLRQVLAARGERRRVIEVRVPGAAGKAMAAGGGLPGPGARLGTQSFDDWLRSQATGPSSVPPGAQASPSPTPGAGGGAP